MEHLDTTQQQALNLPSTCVSDGNGSLRLDYLRGDQSKELLKWWSIQKSELLAR